MSAADGHEAGGYCDYEISVYCDDREHIITFCHAEFGTWYMGGPWVPKLGRWAWEAVPSGSVPVASTHRMVSSHEDQIPGSDRVWGRSRYELECRQCHRKLVGRQETINTALDKLREAGVREVPLRLLEQGISSPR